MGVPFDPSRWRPVEGFDFTDITYHRAIDDTGCAPILAWGSSWPAWPGRQHCDPLRCPWPALGGYRPSTDVELLTNF